MMESLTILWTYLNGRAGPPILRLANSFKLDRVGCRISTAAQGLQYCDGIHPDSHAHTKSDLNGRAGPPILRRHSFGFARPH